MLSWFTLTNESEQAVVNNTQLFLSGFYQSIEQRERAAQYQREYKDAQAVFGHNHPWTSAGREWG